MPDRERTEKVRQQIMRLRELLGLLRGKVAAGERAYEELFTDLAPEDRARLGHKDLQWKAAEQLSDLSPLRQAVAQLRFDTREMEKAFAELYDIIAATPASDE